MASWRERLLSPIATKLDDLDAEFRRQLSSPVPLIAEINGHIARHQGKRIRPALLLLGAQMMNYNGRGDVVFSAVIEFIHTATLIHDDIIDNADMRRGDRSVKAIWGNNVTVLLGDYLYLKSMEFALTQGSLRALEILTEVTIAMIEGELIQLHHKGDLGLRRDGYLDIVERKTAALFTGCGRIAAEISGADDAQTQAFHRYCHDVGMAFQLVDDMLDFVGDPRELGKPVLSDLREGRITLPVIELLELAPSEATDLVRQIVESGAAEQSHVESGETPVGGPAAAAQLELLELVRRHGALDSASALAHEHAKEARKHLAGFPDSRAKRALDLIPDYIVARTS